MNVVRRRAQRAFERLMTHRSEVATSLANAENDLLTELERSAVIEVTWADTVFDLTVQGDEFVLVPKKGVTGTRRSLVGNAADMPGLRVASELPNDCPTEEKDQDRG